MTRSRAVSTTYRPTPHDNRFSEARARRIARRIEALCGRRVAGCRVAAVMTEGGGSFDLSVGRRDGAPEELVWARGLNAAQLDSDAALERLARFLEVWIAPDTVAGSGRPASVSGGCGAFAPAVPGASLATTSSQAGPLGWTRGAGHASLPRGR